jgi:hypothetical protein
MPWLLETVRATVFASDVKLIGLLDWRALAERTPAITEPDQTFNNPGDDSTVVSGSFKGHRLTMGLARRPFPGPGRADLILTIPQSAVLVPLSDRRQRIEPAAIGPFTTSFPEFVTLATEWLSAAANIKRLAIACTLWERASTSDEALKIILSKVRSFKNDKDDRIADFLLQLNRPKASQVNPSLLINRFARWSTPVVELPFPGRVRSPPPRIRSPRAQVDLDISTADGSNIADEQITAHLRELKQLIVGIAENGDTP